MADWAKIVEAKIRVAKQGGKPSRASGDTRVPPGQKVVTDFPVLDLGILPPVTEATWLVPLSQEELRLKIQAIFKHQSQKDSAPFPGPDEREFWQRVEARNKGTAAELDRLGLAEYYAMEAYVVEE